MTTQTQVRSTVEALKLALEEIKRVKEICLREVGIGLCNEVVIAKLEEALMSQGERVAQQSNEQVEPVAWALWWEDDPDYFVDDYISKYKEVVEDEFLPTVVGNPKVIPLYTSPPAQRKPLSNEQIGQAARDAHISFCLDKHQTYEHALTRAIEAAHGIHPTGFKE